MLVTIPDSVTYIGEEAFNGCTNIIVYCEAKSKPLGWADNWNPYTDNPIIWDCKNNDKDQYGNIYFVVDNILYSLSGELGAVFTLMVNLTSINIPEKIIYKNNEYNIVLIGSYAFWGNSSLTSITIPDSITYIGSAVFNYCTSLKDIYYNGTKAQWNEIRKDSSWNEGAGKYTIHCTDGDI